MTDRRRNVLVLLLVTGLILGSLVVIVGIPGVVKQKKTVLGLDLRGGVELVYKGVPTKESAVDSSSIDSAINIMRKRVDQLGVAEPEIESIGSSEIDVSLPGVPNAAKAQAEVGRVAQLEFYDWETNVIGPSGTTAPTSTTVTGGENAGAAQYGLTEYQAVLRAVKRPALNPKTATTYGEWYLIDPANSSVLCAGNPVTVDKPGGAAQIAAAKAEMDSPGGCAGYPKGSVSFPTAAKAVFVEPGTILLQALPPTGSHYINSWFVINDDPVLSGNDVKDPAQSYDNGPGGSGAPIVTFNFTSHGQKVFERVTQQIANRGRNLEFPGTPASSVYQHFAISLDNQLITVPYIDFNANPNGIDASQGSEIEGGFTITTAQQLADELKSGALPIKLDLISQSQVSATLGKTALHQGLIAGLAGLAVVALFLLFFYRMLGLVAVGGLAIYSVYFFALIKLIPVTLTLAGIAGLVLTIGVAADANIVIFERVKEEVRSGRTMLSAIATGYRRGFASIVDANVVTFMTAFILFALSTSDVKGFAFTLMVGTGVSLLTAVLATSAILGTMGRSRLLGSARMLGAAKPKRKFTPDFMGASRWFFSLSGTILLVGAVAIGSRGLNFGIDFKGGTQIKAPLTAKASVSGIDKILAGDKAYKIVNPQVQKTTGKGIKPNTWQISVRTLAPDQVTTIEQQLANRYGVSDLSGFNDTSIGPTFGKTIADAAIVAIISSLIVISIYIALRFEWKYAVPVLIALMHDLLITAGVYSLTGRQVTEDTVAALLTILGYSLYDTIIVFDRVRENVPRMPRAAFSQIVNRSMSEVITRSLATSFCTLLPVLALFIFGGSTLKDFAFALLVGVASGAYSSIFIASPVLTHWKEREPVYRNRRQRIIREFGKVPAYATAAPAAGEDGARTRRTRQPVRAAAAAAAAARPSLLAPEAPGQQLSQQEFDALVADLDIEEGVDAPPARGRRGRGGGSDGPGDTARTRPSRAARQPEPEPEFDYDEDAPAPKPELDPTADASPEDVVMPDQRRRASTNPRRPRNRRHGRR
ncbi:MAG TPA: protein translocase subunit SecD [Solirubrobacteraceae bacterium]|jgi:SecD/SecF fusion protein|nr:protein translocase subunit SecD [Solirubrobacteraceae bacterium]